MRICAGDYGNRGSGWLATQTPRPPKQAQDDLTISTSGNCPKMQHPRNAGSATRSLLGKFREANAFSTSAAARERTPWRLQWRLTRSAAEQPLNRRRYQHPKRKRRQLGVYDRRTPVGHWELALPNTEEIMERFNVLTYTGRTHPWPNS